MPMNKPARTGGSPKAPDRETPAKAATAAADTARAAPAAEGPAANGLSPEAAEAIADIAQRSTRLLQIYAERLQQEDGYQVIDPRTVAATLQEFLPVAAADPGPVLKEQMA